MMEKTVVQGAAVSIGFILGYLAYVLYSKPRTVKLARHLLRKDYKLVMVVRTDISLTKSQIAVYCSRAALECYKKAKLTCPEAVLYWERNSQPKIALKINERGNEQIIDLLTKAADVGLVSVPIVNEGGPAPPKDYSVIGIGPGPAELIDKVTGHLKLL